MYMENINDNGIRVVWNGDKYLYWYNLDMTYWTLVTSLKIKLIWINFNKNFKTKEMEFPSYKDMGAKDSKEPCMKF